MNIEIPRSPAVLHVFFHNAQHIIRVWGRDAQQCLRTLSRQCHDATRFAIPFILRRLKL